MYGLNAHALSVRGRRTMYVHVVVEIYTESNEIYSPMRKLLHSMAHSLVTVLLEGVLTHNGSGEVLKEDRESCLHRTSSCHHLLALQHPLHHAQGVVHRALHLVHHEVVGTSQDDGGCTSGSWAVRNIGCTLSNVTTHAILVKYASSYILVCVPV